MKRDDKHYDIYFVDPKGTKITDYEQKVYYYKTFFYNDKQHCVKEFSCDHGITIRVYLRLVTDDMNKVNVSNEYREFWFSNKDFSFLEK